MCVTFRCPGAPSKQIPCQFCDESWAEFPEGNGKGGKCDRLCTGFETQSDAPEADFAEGNAVAILRLLGFDTSDVSCLYGECDAGTMRQRIMRARSTDRSALVREVHTEAGGYAGTKVVEGEDGLPTIQRMGPTTHFSGNTDERTLERLASLEALALWAQAHNMQIHWS